jgi:hypothetical protein
LNIYISLAPAGEFMAQKSSPEKKKGNWGIVKNRISAQMMGFCFQNWMIWYLKK